MRASGNRLHRIALAAGGTGGHVYPALAVLTALLERSAVEEVFFFGRREGLEKTLMGALPVRYVGLSVCGFPRKVSIRWLTAPLLALGSFLTALWTFLRRRPQLVIGFGSYVAGPVLVAAICLRIPALIHEQNSYPGLANRWLAPWVDRVLIADPDTAGLLRCRRIETVGIPLRKEVLEAKADPGALGLRPGLKTVLIFGGSQGARKLCQAAVEALPMLEEELQGWQALLIAGPGNYEETRKQVKLKNVVVKDYVEEMGAAYAASSLVVSRAGAVSLAEITAHGLPSILIPLAIATGGHQAKNARALEQQGAARVIENAALTPAVLADAMRPLLREPERLAAMANASRRLGHPNATEAFIEQIMEMGSSC